MKRPGRANNASGYSFMVQTIQDGGAPIHAWIDGVPLEDSARAQLLNVASLPFIHHHIAAMPDVHWGMGATVGSVIPTKGAIIPAAVGVDIGCGMVAAKTSLPVLGVPVKSRALDGLDSLLSIAQMPAGIPVATFAIGAAGAKNAALFAAAILAYEDKALALKLEKFRSTQTKTVLKNPNPRA